MKSILALAILLAAIPAKAIEWGVEVSVKTPSGREYSEYYFSSEPGMLAIRSPNKNWVCGFKVDSIRKVDEMEEGNVLLQNAFLGCKSPDGIMLNTGASIIYYSGVIVERDTTFILLGGTNELTMRLVPCVGKYKSQCIDWKSK